LIWGHCNRSNEDAFSENCPDSFSGLVKINASELFKIVVAKAKLFAQNFDTAMVRSKPHPVNIRIPAVLNNKQTKLHWYCVVPLLLLFVLCWSVGVLLKQKIINKLIII